MKRYFFRGHNSNDRLNGFLMSLRGVFAKRRGNPVEIRKAIIASFKSRPLLSIFSLVLIILIPIYYLTVKFTNPASEAAWFDDTFQYRKAISITNTSGSNLTDFQVSISIGTSAPIATGKMKSDCSDIRITDQTGKILPHWIEENNPGCNAVADAKVWVKVPSIHTSGGVLYVYYGNPNANNIANGNEVFEFFDDFSQDLNKWTNVSNAPWIVSSGILNLTTGSAYNYLTANKSISASGIAIEARIKSNHTAGQSHPGLFWHANNLSGISNHRNDHVYLRPHSYNTTSNIQSAYHNGGLATSSSFTGLFNFNTWYNVKIEIPSTNSVKFYRDDVNEANFGGQQYLSNTYTGIAGHDGSNMQWDNYRVRKIASTQPTTNMSSTEEKSLGPVAYWKFDEGVGSILHDATSNRKNGNLATGSSAPSWATEDQCISGKCLSFNGNNYVTLPNNIYSVSDSRTTGITYSAWVKTVNNTKEQRIFGQQISSGYSDYSSGGLGISSSGKAQMIVYDDTGAYRYAVGSTTLKNNQWYLLTGAYNAVDKNIKIYVNGVLDGNAVSIGTFSRLYSNDSNRIGLKDNSTQYTFVGNLDEIKIYGYSRTPAQIKSDYNAGLARQSSDTGLAAAVGSVSSSNLSNGLVGYWKMDENTGTSINDFSGNNIAGSFTGIYSPTWSFLKYGSSLTFDGSNDYVTLSQPVINNATVWTVNTRLKYLTKTSQFEFFLGRNDAGTTGKILLRYGGNISFRAINGTYYNFSVTSAEINNVYSELSFVSDGTTIKLYVNGILRSTVIPSSTSFSVDSIGNAWSDLAWTSAFVLDDLRIYNRALSPSEVADLYNYAPGPVGYWDFEEGVGSTAYDKSGNNYSGALINGASWSTGKYGKALRFDGQNDYIDILDSGSSSKTSNLYSATYSFWINPKSLLSSSGNLQRLIEKRDNTISTAVNTDGTINTYIWYASNGDNWNSTYKLGYYDTGVNEWTVKNLNKWYYLTFIFDSVGNVGKTYINGQLAREYSLVNCSNRPIGTISSSVGTQLGRYRYDSNYFFNGSIDELKVYNYARSNSQIIEDMNGGHALGGSPVGSQAQYWKFDGNINNSIPSGTAAAASLGGTVSYTNNGKFGKGLDFTELYSGNFTYVSNNTFSDSSKNWATNELVGFQFATDYAPNSEYCQQNIISNTQTTITFSNTCSSFAGNKAYRIKKTLYISGPIPNHTTDKISGSLWFRSNGSQSARITRASNEAMHFTITSNSVSVGAISYANSTTYLTNPHDGNWHYLALVYDGINQKLYYDGLFRGMNALSGAVSANGSLTIGSRNDGAQEFFNGQVDEVKVYNAALTDEEIKLDYNRGQAMQMGTLSSGTGNTAPSNAASQEYCVPGDTVSCAPPVAEWRLNEGVGNTANDSSGNSLNGSVGGGANWTSGKNGKGLNFLGTTQNVFIADNSLLKPATITVEAWFNTRNKTLVGQRIVSKTEGSGYQLSINENAVCPVSSLCFIVNIGGSYYSASYSNSNLSNNVWYHAVGTYDGQTIKLYVNGMLVNSTNQAGTINQAGYPFCIGNESAVSVCSGGGFNGQIDDVKVFNYVRTPAQIAWDYNKGAPVAWWKMDECQGTTLNDSSGNNLIGNINIGASGSQTTAGTCSTASTAWGVGATGRFNSSLNFDGVDDYVNIPDPASGILDFGTNDFTTSTWFKTTTTNATIIGKYCSYPLYNTTISSGVINSRIGFDASTNYIGNNGSAVNDNAWHNIVTVYKRNGNMTRYLDGKIYGSAVDISSSSTITVSNVNSFTLAAACGPSQTFSGQIDDTRVYNYALTQDQVKQLYNGGAINFAPAVGSP